MSLTTTGKQRPKMMGFTKMIKMCKIIENTYSVIRSTLNDIECEECGTINAAMGEAANEVAFVMDHTTEIVDDLDSAYTTIEQLEAEKDELYDLVKELIKTSPNYYFLIYLSKEQDFNAWLESIDVMPHTFPYIQTCKDTNENRILVSVPTQEVYALAKLKWDSDILDI